MQRVLSVFDKAPRKGGDAAEVAKDRKHFNGGIIGQRNIFISFLLKMFYLFLFLEREEGREGERESSTSVREKHQLVASCVRLDQGPNLQPRHAS